MKVFDAQENDNDKGMGGFKWLILNNLLSIGFIIFLLALLLIAFNSPGFFDALFSLFK